MLVLLVMSVMSVSVLDLRLARGERIRGERAVRDDEVRQTRSSTAIPTGAVIVTVIEYRREVERRGELRALRMEVEVRRRRAFVVVGRRGRQDGRRGEVRVGELGGAADGGHSPVVVEDVVVVVEVVVVVGVDVVVAVVEHVIAVDML